MRRSSSRTGPRLSIGTPRPLTPTTRSPHSTRTARRWVAIVACTRPRTDRLRQANIKLEAYGSAILDANKAIELDPNNVKVRAGFPSLARRATYRTRRHTTAAPPRTPRYSTTERRSETGSSLSRKRPTTMWPRCA
ncbi:hypothetical protein BU26DRAFT_264018 [Trematosphaeria pertusa]|uniref:TPR-like protein n=1 Tax=Trematosphaeria pertusa TaxID=390896 RepID=A0A6A6IJX1_9PLEO|nr:uncharacterized protein BU26DRAFT_264018 [Trematosphaeria pertusa]KAF2250477.1 hypothetical protein BU26DRAFT_264018 [Trematosphaeria pertusa]